MRTKQTIPSISSCSRFCIFRYVYAYISLILKYDSSIRILHFQLDSISVYERKWAGATGQHKDGEAPECRDYSIPIEGGNRKVGATNLFNHYYASYLGGPAVGGMYYTMVSASL